MILQATSNIKYILQATLQATLNTHYSVFSPTGNVLDHANSTNAGDSFWIRHLLLSFLTWRFQKPYSHNDTFRRNKGRGESIFTQMEEIEDGNELFNLFSEAFCTPLPSLNQPSSPRNLKLRNKPCQRNWPFFCLVLIPCFQLSRSQERERERETHPWLSFGHEFS